MEKAWNQHQMVAAVVVVIVLNLVALSQATESPIYKTIHSESDEFEIRYYNHSVWVSAQVNHPSFHQATKIGFHRLFQYIQGANLNWTRIPMTKPVLTSIVPETASRHSSSYVVHFYLPLKFQGTPPLPLPELNLKPVAWPGATVLQLGSFRDLQGMAML